MLPCRVAHGAHRGGEECLALLFGEERVQGWRHVDVLFGTSGRSVGPSGRAKGERTAEMTLELSEVVAYFIAVHGAKGDNVHLCGERISCEQSVQFGVILACENRFFPRLNEDLGRQRLCYTLDDTLLPNRVSTVEEGNDRQTFESSECNPQQHTRQRLGYDQLA